MRRLERIAILLCIAALAACDGSNPPRKSVDEDAREAAELQVKLGRGYMDQGKLEVANERLQRALQLDPRSVDANTVMAVLQERINRPEQAEKYYRRAVQLAPENGNANNNLGAFLCGVGKYGEADVHFARALNDPFYHTPVAAMTNAGVCAQQGGNTAKAEEYFRRVLAVEPDNATALYEMTRMNYFKNDPLRARAFLQRLEAVAGGDPRVIDLGQRIETLRGNAAGARVYAKRLKDEHPDYTPDASLQGPSSP